MLMSGFNLRILRVFFTCSTDWRLPIPPTSLNLLPTFGRTETTPSSSATSQLSTTNYAMLCPPAFQSLSPTLKRYLLSWSRRSWPCTLTCQNYCQSIMTIMMRLSQPAAVTPLRAFGGPQSLISSSGWTVMPLWFQYCVQHIQINSASL